MMGRTMKFAKPLNHSFGKQLARVEAVEILEQGLVVGILLREIDGTISAVRITVEQLAD